MDKKFFGLAAEEVANGEVDAALLVKSIALSDGDEKRGRALYIKLRAEEISREITIQATSPHRARDPEPVSENEIARGAKALRDSAIIFISILACAGIVAMLAHHP